MLNTPPNKQEKRRATIDELRKILFLYATGYDIPKEIKDVLYFVAKKEIEDKRRVVLIKRDPDIYRTRIQAAYVRIIEGTTIDIHPTTVGGFGADFDGDTMSVFVPLSEEAQREAKEKMITVFSAETISSSLAKLTNEMLTGLYTLTTFEIKGAPIKIKSNDELKMLHPGTPIIINQKNQQIVTTAGRAVFNLALPNWYPFVNEPVNKKKVEKILSEVLAKGGPEQLRIVVDNLMRLGFQSATRYPRTVSLDIFVNIPPHIYKLKEELLKEKDIMKQQQIINQMEKELEEHIRRNQPELRDLLFSGAAKGISQLRQIMVAKGLFTDPKGNILPAVASSISDGFKPIDYFNASSGARKGIISRVKLTAKGGYAYRKMVYIVGNVTAGRLKDCNTRRVFYIKLTPELFQRMKGRYIQEDPKSPPKPLTEKYIGKVIPLRSPIFCKTLDICRTCYGDLLQYLNSSNVGLIAVQEVTSLSERIMKAFHTGGATDIKRHDILKLLKEHIEEDSIVDESFYQDKDTLFSKKRVELIIDLDLFRKFNKRVDEDEQNINLSQGHVNLVVDNVILLLSISDPITVHKTYIEREEEGQKLRLKFDVNKPILSINPYQLSPEAVASFLDKLVGGKVVWSSVSDLYLKFYKYLSQFGNWDSVHLEVIISNILRNKRDPRLPARVVEPYEPATYSVKQLPGLISWTLGLAYEDFSKALTFGLVSPKGIETPIERALFGKSVAEKR